MWNAVFLKGEVKGNPLNLAIAAKELCVAIKAKGKIKASYSRSKRLMKAQKMLEKNKPYADVVYELVKFDGLSKRTFKRSVKVTTDKDNVEWLYVNYKYLNQIIESMLDYILIVDENILINLFNFSKKHYSGKDSVTYRTIPAQKTSIKKISTAYINGEKCYLKNKYFQRMVCLLNRQLDELNIRRRGVL